MQYAKDPDARKLRERHAEDILTIGRTEPTLPKDFGDMITADHNVLNDEQESRVHHKYKVFVQDVATQWIHSYPCETKQSQETMRGRRQFSHPEKSEIHLFGQLSGFH